MFQDYLFYGTDVETRYAFRMLHMTTLVRHAQSLHGVVGPQAELLGLGLLSGVLLASILEDEERINLRFHSGNDCTMGVETTRHAVTRGYLEANPQSELVQQLNARQQPLFPWVVRSLRSKAGSANLFEGISGSETDSLEYAVNQHLESSYQMKTRLKLDCWTGTDGLLYAMGVIYLELPHLSTDISHQLWNHVDGLPLLRNLFHEKSHDPDKLSSALIPHQVRAINSINPSWGCSCSDASVELMLKKLGHVELQNMVDEGEPAEVRCHYCNKNYTISLQRLRQMVSELTGDTSENQKKVLN